MSHVVCRYFPFHALGFRCNPFRALTDEEWVEVAVLPESVVKVLESGFVHLQIIGALGCGKTTTLLGLAARFAREGWRVAYEYLAEGESRFRTNVRDLDFFLLDEAQRLSPRQRARLLLAATGQLRLVLSSHEDLALLFARRGLPLTTVRLDTTTRDHLRAVLERRLSYFALSDAPPMTFTPEAVNYLSETCGNLRAVEQFLYEVFQRLRSESYQFTLQSGMVTEAMLRGERGLRPLPNWI